MTVSGRQTCIKCGINMEISTSVGFVEKNSAYICPDDEEAASNRPLLCTSGRGVTSGRHEP